MTTADEKAKMIQITDREDFTDKFAFLMVANVSMISAGAPPRAELAEQMVNHFLDQFDKPAPKTDHTRNGDTPYGYVIRDRWDGREIPDFKDSFYLSEEAAIASIDQAYARPDYNEFLIIPLYL